MTEEGHDERARTPVDLSAAARAIVRDPGDPRIEAHLAALGLGDDSAPPAAARTRRQAGAAAEVAELRRKIGELEHELESVRLRIRRLEIALGAAAVAILILLAVTVLR